jgi:hypothetical protein
MSYVKSMIYSEKTVSLAGAYLFNLYSREEGKKLLYKLKYNFVFNPALACPPSRIPYRGENDEFKQVYLGYYTKVSNEQEKSLFSALVRLMIYNLVAYNTKFEIFPIHTYYKGESISLVNIPQYMKTTFNQTFHLLDQEVTDLPASKETLDVSGSVSLSEMKPKFVTIFKKETTMSELQTKYANVPHATVELIHGIPVENYKEQELVDLINKAQHELEQAKKLADVSTRMKNKCERLETNIKVYIEALDKLPE